MNRYRIFIISFCLSMIAMVVFMVQYINGIMHFMQDSIGATSAQPPNPFVFFNYFFSPLFIISILALGLFSLLYRILGILFVAKNKKLEGGEQALWIIGFVLMGFITAIIFMALAKSKQMIVENPVKPNSDADY